MSILSSLVRAYERKAATGTWPAFGFSQEKIGYLIALGPDGVPVGAPHDLRQAAGKKKTVPRLMAVPQPPKRASGIAPNFLWDKTAYTLGITAGEGRRTALEHEAFRTRHREWLAGTDDAGLLAFLGFLDWWSPEKFAALEWPEEMQDQNVVFALESERLADIRIHDRPAARSAWARVSAEGEKSQAICLVTGERAPVARLHPSIKGVWNAQSAGASIVSFNLNAFTSYGHEQGDNAPVSEAAAFAYTTALNEFLKSDSGHRIQLADASTVFWADSDDPKLAETAEQVFSAMHFPPVDLEPVDVEEESKNVGEILAKIKQGRVLSSFDPDLAEGVRFYVLGLAPNASRISIRFWYEDTFGALAKHYQEYLNDIRMEPQPLSAKPLSFTRLAVRTAPARVEKNGTLKFDADRNTFALVADLFVSVLNGNRFPGALLSILLTRIRADGVLDRLRLMLIKAVLVRNMRLEQRLPKDENGNWVEDYLVRSDPDDPNPARRLGRLFALIERAQSAALGDEINAAVRDKFLSAAAVAPAQVLPKLVQNAIEHHLKRLRNGHSDAKWIKSSEQARSVGFALEREIGRLFASFTDGLPGQLSNEEQGLFLVGYFQERFKERVAEADDTETDELPPEGE